MYTRNRDPNFGLSSYSSFEKLCFNGPKRFTRHIFDSFKIDWVINFKILEDLPLPNKAYHGCLSLLYMVYQIKHKQLSHKFYGEKTVCNCKTFLPLPLYLTHPYKHPLIEKGLRLSNVWRGGWIPWSPNTSCLSSQILFRFGNTRPIVIEIMEFW